MHVSLINNCSINNNTMTDKYTTSFTSVSSSICDETGKFLYKNNTSFFRFDMAWDDLVIYLAEKYKSAHKVNIVNHACSSGYEPYSLAMALKVNLGKLSRKFFPIKARDIDPNNIKVAKSGIFKVDKFEKMGIDNYTFNTFSDYFMQTTIKRKYNYNTEVVYKPLDTIKSLIKSKQSNILDDTRKLSKKNTVLLCRNFWPYLDKIEVATLAEKLAKKMRKNSLVIIGEYDHSFKIHKILKEFGFKETPIEHVYEAPGRSRKTRLQAKIAKETFLKNAPDGKMCLEAKYPNLVDTKSVQLFSDID